MDKKVRWGIVGCGRIAADFVRAMPFAGPENEVLAVATADSLERARQFCRDNQLDSTQLVRCYGTHAELFADTQIDVVYIATLNHQHLACVLGALDAGKHVLCEKPMALNERQARQMAEKARGKGLFLMEGYWTCCFPIWREIHEKRLSELGRLDFVQCDFGFPVNRVNSSPAEIRDGGEGYLLATGCYAVMATQKVFRGQSPVEIVVRGERKDAIEKGWDICASILLRFADGQRASIFYSGGHRTPGSFTICGAKGNIRIGEMFWSPVGAVLEQYAPSGKLRANASTRTQIDRPLPECSPDAFYYPHAVGLSYEIGHVRECIAKGMTESDLFGLDDSIRLAASLDEIRRQLGVAFPQD